MASVIFKYKQWIRLAYKYNVQIITNIYVD